MVEFVENSNAIAVKINLSYKEGMGTFQIYECARSAWRIDKNKVDQIKYVVVVFKGEIKEVFKVAGWFDAGSTLSSVERLSIENKVEFVGCLAEDKIREKYNGRRLEDFIGDKFETFRYMTVQ